jgi:hypothetical protein
VTGAITKLPLTNQIHVFLSRAPNDEWWGIKEQWLMDRREAV